MDFSVMFFSSVDEERVEGRYHNLLSVARAADRLGFIGIWTPERHFHPFGGLFPHPAVLSAALAMVTERLRLRAGSLISPLHDSLRIAESWSVVDNLSRGRVEISFGSGWNIGDFVFFPQRYPERQATMFRQIEEVRAAWRGASQRRLINAQDEIDVRTYPRPVQMELPIWVTSSGNVDTFASAGRIDAGLLTHLIGQDVPTLRRKIELYREARTEAGLDPKAGRVALMLHAYLDRDVEAARQTVRRPMREYLRSAVNLEQLAALGGGAISGGHEIDPHEIPSSVMEELLDLAFERYFTSASLLGSPESCEPLVWSLIEAEVDEVACLVDFLDDHRALLASLEILAEFKERFSAAALENAGRAAIKGFMSDFGS